MTQTPTAGGRFRRALREERPLQIIGTVNAYAAMLATRTGYRAIYLSGAGVANYSYGLPDLGMTSLDDVLTDVRRALHQAARFEAAQGLAQRPARGAEAFGEFGLPDPRSRPDVAAHDRVLQRLEHAVGGSAKRPVVVDDRVVHGLLCTISAGKPEK